MEQQIRFCTSADGTRIAYATYGQPGGRPIVTVHAWSVVQARIRGWPAAWEYYEVLTSDRQLIAFDRRGIGASQRDVDDVGLEAQIADLTAIADDAGFETFDIAGTVDGAAVAAAYAAQNPARVARLALAFAYSHGEELTRPERAHTIAALIREDWSLGRRALADLLVTDESIEARRGFTHALRDSISAEVAARYVEYYSSLDVRQELMSLSSPALVVQYPWSPAIWRTAAVSVASMIPDARLVTVEGQTEVPTAYLQRQFFAEGSENLPVEAIPSGTAIILFADIVDSTALTERLGDAAFREKARNLDTALRSLIREHAGTAIEGKLLGDGVLAVFTSARQAIEAALACGKVGDDGGLPLHLGLHAGDVSREKDLDGRDNVYGGAVNIASRISGLSAPGEVLVSDTVRGLARTSAGVKFEDRGEQALKGIGEPFRVWAVVSARPNRH